jgi:hypothetical protein
MTNARLMALHRCAQNLGGYPRGTALLFEQQFGKLRQIDWLIANRLAKKVGGRAIATKKGLRELGKRIRD